VSIPPLRERADDIPSIVTHHLSVIAERDHTPLLHMSSASLAKLFAYGWPGNVRELLATIERAALCAKDHVIDEADISLPQSTGEKQGLLAYRDAKAEWERMYFETLMRMTRGNVSLAAVLAKKTRKEIYDALKRTGLQRPRHSAVRKATRSASSAGVKLKPSDSS
jgi:two-component system response regulator GlrR